MLWLGRYPNPQPLEDRTKIDVLSQQSPEALNLVGMVEPNSFLQRTQRLHGIERVCVDDDDGDLFQLRLEFDVLQQAPSRS